MTLDGFLKEIQLYDNQLDCYRDQRLKRYVVIRHSKKRRMPYTIFVIYEDRKPDMRDFQRLRDMDTAKFKNTGEYLNWVDEQNEEIKNKVKRRFDDRIEAGYSYYGRGLREGTVVPVTRDIPKGD